MKILKYLIPVILLSASIASAAISEQKPLSVNDLPDFTVPKGQVVYQRYCLFCHGKTGKGDGPNSFSLKTRPADFSKIIAERDEEQLVTIIQQGGMKKGLSPDMPRFEHTLSKKQLRQLILYLKNISQKDR